jgi:hypothetical protein
MKHFICLVTDSKGEQDLIDVLDLESVPSKWIECTVLREIVE